MLHEFKLYLSSVENLWISLETRGKTKIIGVVYRHPDKAAEAVNEFNEKLSNIMYQPVAEPRGGGVGATTPPLSLK